jgi:REP element-mobilizing transposase RayT
MTYDPRIHHRRSIRLRGYDYAGGGAYFITICTQDKEFLFGQIVEGNMVLSEQGSIVQRIWDALPRRFPSLVQDAFQMMPNHLHAIFVLPGPGLEEALALATGAPIIQPTPSNFVGRFHENDRIVGVGLALPSTTNGNAKRDSAAIGTEGRAIGIEGTASRPPTRRVSMGDVVGAFKSISTIALNKFMSRPGAHPLHENFYEHIIRDTHELEMIRDYIIHNPERWLEDPENPKMPEDET